MRTRSLPVEEAFSLVKQQIPGGQKAPSHLSKSAITWWNEVVSRWVLEPHHIKVLQAACEAWDRMQQARRIIDKHGILIQNRYGNLTANPAVAIEKDSRTAFLRAVRELDLDIDPPSDAPRLRGRA